MSETQQSDFRFKSLEDFVADRKAKRVIRRVLVANNGIAAVKCMRSIRQWCYHTFGNDRMVQFVAMATPEDLKVGAEYIKLADSYEEVPGGRNNRNYANVEVIVDVAKRQGCDAVWAGWGHASEFPSLPSALVREGLVFLGPGAKAMHDLGDKIASSILAQSASVPCIPWSGDGVTVDYKTEGIPPEKFAKCCVNTVDECVEVVKRIGLPVMIKASEGGGGKGIRKVEQMDQLVPSFSRVRAEVPGSPIFVMRMGSNCRHLEVQILGDEYGNALALYGRDCSIQRRHQKIIEEGPIVVAPGEMLRTMEQAAVRLAKEVGYVGAGTIEYLYTDSKYYFLELNPRLQVEHPVTELICDVNLPAAQLCIGMGVRLDMIPHIRAMYRGDPLGHDPIDLDKVEPRPPKGHVIACRITAENPLKGFQPTSGNIQELNFRSIPNVWGYFSVSSGGGVHEFADSQIGHLFAWAPSRDICRSTIILGLKELSIRGDISTPVDYLIRLMETPAFRNNTTSTSWLDGLIAEMSDNMLKSTEDDSTVVVCGAVFQAYRKLGDRRRDFLKQLSAGRIPTRQLLQITDRIPITYGGVEYVCDVKACSSESFWFELVPPTNGASSAGELGESGLSRSMSPSMQIPRPRAPGFMVEVRPFVDGGLLIIFNGKSRMCFLTNTPPTGWKLIIDKKQHILESQRDPTKIFTPSNGKIVKYLVPNGSHVKAGTAFVECEIMKMILPLVCDIDGTLTFPHAEGTVVETGELIAKVEPDDVSSIRKARPFKGDFPHMAAPRAPETKSHLCLADLQKSVDNVLAGYFHPDVVKLTNDYLNALFDKTVPLSRFLQTLSEHKAVLPNGLKTRLEEICNEYESALRGATDVLPQFPGKRMEEAVHAHAASLPDTERSGWVTSVSGLSATLADLASWDCNAPEASVVKVMLQSYLSLEDKFEGKPQEVALMELREANKGNIDEVFRVALSFYSDVCKVDLLAEILSELDHRYRISSYKDVLRRFYVLPKPRHVRLSLVAGRVLSHADRPSPEKQLELLRAGLAAIPEGAAEDVTQARVLELLTRQASPLDALICAYEQIAKRPYLVGSVLRQYISLLIGSLPFQEAKVTVAEKNPKVSFNWTTAPVDVNDQGFPTSAQSNAGATNDLDVPASRSSTGPTALRNSLACVFPTMEETRRGLADVLQTYKAPNDATTRNILVLVVLDSSDHVPVTSRGPTGIMSPSQGFRVADKTSNDDASKSGLMVQNMLKEHIAALTQHRIVRVTVVLGRFPQTPFFHTYRLRHDFTEDLLYRNFVPELGFLLELRRLDHYELELCSAESSRVLVYAGLERLPPGSKRAPASRESRLFVRGFVDCSTSQEKELDWNSSVFQDSLIEHLPMIESQLKMIGSEQEAKQALRLLREVESVFVESLNALEVVISNRRQAPSSSNSLFIALMTNLDLRAKLVKPAIPLFMRTFAERLYALNVHMLELVINAPGDGKKYESLRFVVTNYSGVLWRVKTATESRSLSLGVPSPRLMLKSSAAGKLAETTPSYLTQYVPNAQMSRRRVHCRALGTTYVYDLLDVLERSLYDVWKEAHDKHGLPKLEHNPVVSAVEYRLNKEDIMHPVPDAVPGSNDVGMVAWKITIETPEYPKGRDIILISNDVSFEGGSFGPREDALYKQASALARTLGIPRIYISANAGARIGLADEVVGQFQVAWKDEANPGKGFDYFYLSPEKAKEMSKSVKVRPVPGHADRMEITDIIGAQHGIGVENLQGSGLIAGETSLAYRETFTLTVVTGRSVGIGAYVTRLGQRVIQNQGPILLTGYDALNRLLGREVYISHTQMGGPLIMYRNGVSHIDVSSDLDAFRAMLKWLSFVPRAINQALPILPATALSDPVDRPVAWHPEPSIAYDPRFLLDGQLDANGVWRSGFFDRGSFVETLGGWAKTVVTGRARLGGIPVGVIAVETRTVQKIVPADPASEESREEIIQQAGQVWYPDSAFKTAQAILDFNVGEQLPLFIFANWRGFSGGVSDMFNEVLKFGSMIVDALSVFKQPVFVYMPPFAELRGGSWAVIDPYINPDGMIEMYTSESAQGGILEPTGTVAIKFRKREQIASMVRLDQKMKELDSRKDTLLKQVKGEDPVQAASAQLELQQVQKQIDERAELLSKVYHTIALRFCELHDTPGRMLEKRVVSDIVPWKDSRSFFGRRLKRRLAELGAVAQIHKASPEVTREQALEVLFRGYAGDKKDDVAVTKFLEDTHGKLDQAVQDDVTSKLLKDAAEAINSGNVTALQALVKNLDAKAKEALKGLL